MRYRFALTLVVLVLCAWAGTPPVHAAPAHYFKQEQYDGISFLYGSSLTASIQPKMFSRNQAAPLPPFLGFAFHGYLLSAYTPDLQVFATHDLRMDRYDALNLRAVESLLRSHRALADARALPTLAGYEGRQLFHARAHYLRFKNGQGYVFLAAYALGNETSLSNNGNGVEWDFEGLTSDGRYGIAFNAPVSVRGLPRVSRARLPANLVPYLRHIVSLVENNPQNSFVPYLNNLDRIVLSLDVHPRRMPH